MSRAECNEPGNQWPSEENREIEEVESQPSHIGAAPNEQNRVIPAITPVPSVYPAAARGVRSAVTAMQPTIDASVMTVRPVDIMVA